MSPEIIYALLIPAVLMPWMAWVSKQLWAINQHTAGTLGTLDDHERRISQIEELHPRQVVIVSTPLTD